MRGIWWVIVTLSTLAVLGGCSNAARGSWAEPTLSPIDAASEASFRSYADVADAARVAGTIVTGTFIRHDSPAAIAEIFPAANEQTADARALDVINKTRVATLWTFRVDAVIKGDKHLAGAELTVIAERAETDVSGVAVDPGRVGDQQVVLLLSTQTDTSADGRVIHYFVGSHQVGVPFAVVRSGTLEYDPNMVTPVGKAMKLEDLAAIG